MFIKTKLALEAITTGPEVQKDEINKGVDIEKEVIAGLVVKNGSHNQRKRNRGLQDKKMAIKSKPYRRYRGAKAIC